MDGHQTGADLTDCSECRTRQPRHGAELVRHLPALDPPSTKYAVQISAWPGPVQSSYKHAVSWCLPSFPRHPTLWRCLSRLLRSVLVEGGGSSTTGQAGACGTARDQWTPEQHMAGGASVKRHHYYHHHHHREHHHPNLDSAAACPQHCSPAIMTLVASRLHTPARRLQASNIRLVNIVTIAARVSTLTLYHQLGHGTLQAECCLAPGVR